MNAHDEIRLPPSRTITTLPKGSGHLQWKSYIVPMTFDELLHYLLITERTKDVLSALLLDGQCLDDFKLQVKDRLTDVMVKFQPIFKEIIPEDEREEYLAQLSGAEERYCDLRRLFDEKLESIKSTLLPGGFPSIDEELDRIFAGHAPRFSMRSLAYMWEDRIEIHNAVVHELNHMSKVLLGQEVESVNAYPHLAWIIAQKIIDRAIGPAGIPLELDLLTVLKEAAFSRETDDFKNPAWHLDFLLRHVLENYTAEKAMNLGYTQQADILNAYFKAKSEFDSLNSFQVCYDMDASFSQSTLIKLLNAIKSYSSWIKANEINEQMDSITADLKAGNINPGYISESDMLKLRFEDGYIRITMSPYTSRTFEKFRETYQS